MRILLAFLAGGAFFVALGQLAGPFATVLAAGAILLVVIVGEAWQHATEVAANLDDRETARRRWIGWFGRG